MLEMGADTLSNDSGTGGFDMTTLNGKSAHLRGAVRKCLLLICLGSLGACASFSAMPRPVVPTAEAVAIAPQYRVDEALRRYHSPLASDRGGMDPRQWRDQVIGIYLDATEARYQEFRIGLSQEMRGANFGIDIGVIALSAVGTLASGGTANALAAATGGLTGARASLAKELYFERTLPALIAAMDAARDEILTGIYQNLLKPETEYSLERAFADFRALERAASLDQAVQRVTVQAATDAAEQHQAFQNVQTVVRTIPATSRPEISRIRDNINALVNANNDSAFGLVMARLGLPRTGSLQQQSTAALINIGNLSEADRATVLNDLKQQNVDLARAPGG